MLHMISYDLRVPGQNYNDLHKRITSLGGKRILESQWLLVHDAASDRIWNDMRAWVDSSDGLLVNELTRNAQWTKGGLLITDDEMKSFLAQARC